MKKEGSASCFRQAEPRENPKLTLQITRQIQLLLQIVDLFARFEFGFGGEFAEAGREGREGSGSASARGI